MMTGGFSHNLAAVDRDNLVAVRDAVQKAHEVGHWRRLFAIFADHLSACACWRDAPCDCGFVSVLG